MARVFLDGFESGSYDLYDAWSGTLSVASGVSGFSGYCLSMGTDATLDKAIDASAQYYAAFKFKHNAGVGHNLIKFMNGGTVLGTLKLENTLVLSAYRGDAANLLVSSVTAINISTVYLIEVRYLPDTTNGIFTVKVNGSVVINYAGNTTAAALQINQVRLCGVPAGGFSASNFDDLILDNSAWIGNTAIQRISPNAIGNSSQWTPSAGNNYECVDEVPVSDADYNAINAVDQLDTYGASDLSGVIANVKCLQVQARCIQEGAPTPLNIKLAIRSGGVDYVSGDRAVPTTTAKSVANIWETNPLDASVWLEAEINALEIGMKSAA